MSSFGSISTALSALQSHRKAMDVTGNNIANANTPGYTRQRAELQSLVAPGVQSLFSTSKLTGNGVEVLGTSRLADAFLDARVRSQTSTSADLTGRAETLTSIEQLLAEPSDKGLASQLKDMWDAWSVLADHPELEASRTSVLEASKAVVQRITSSATGVETLWDQAHTQARGFVTEVNETARSVAGFNEQIRSAVTNGGSPNELMDQRDQLVVRLTELTGATAHAGADGVVDVFLGSNALVRGTSSSAVDLDPEGATKLGDLKSGATPEPPSLVWVTGGAATPRGGSLAASFDAMGSTLLHEARQYDKVAWTLATSVNKLHEAGAGLDGQRGPLFTGRDGTPPTTSSSTGSSFTASDLTVWISDPRALAAAAPGEANGAFDGSVAQAIAASGSGDGGPDAVWNTHVVGRGVETRAAKLRADVAQQSLSAAVGDQMASAGVSIDEETANLLMIQRAYEGAARVLTAVDQALDTLINRTGLVGR